MNRRKLKVLFITPHLTDRPAAGGYQVSCDRLAALSARHDVTVLCLNAEGKHDLRVVRAGALRPRTAAGLARSYAAGQPLSVWRNACAPLLEASSALARESWDLVYVDHWLMWPSAEAFRGSRRVLHLHNAEHLLFSRVAERLPAAQAFAARLEAIRARRYLARICREATEVHYLSGQDQSLSEADGIVSAQTSVFPPRCETPPARAGERNPAMGEVFTLGSLSWEPTRAGTAWFLEQVWPRIHETLHLTVGGKGADAALSAQLGAAPRTDVLGFVGDAEPYYERARVFIAPLLDGSGIKIKIINALRRGIPVVTTSVGVEGFPAGFNEFVAVADTPEAFAAHTKRLATLEIDSWRELSKKSEFYTRVHFSGAQFDEWCAGL